MYYDIVNTYFEIIYIIYDVAKMDKIIYNIITDISVLWEGFKMDQEKFIKDWRKFLVDVGMSETEIAKSLGTSQTNLNRKIRTGSIKYLEIAEIVEQYGFTVEIRKKE
jgi:hypothetical protein